MTWLLCSCTLVAVLLQQQFSSHHRTSVRALLQASIDIKSWPPMSVFALGREQLHVNECPELVVIVRASAAE